VSADSYNGEGKLRVFVRDVTLMSSKGETQQQAPQPAAPQQQDTASDFDDDSIPF